MKKYQIDIMHIRNSVANYTTLVRNCVDFPYYHNRLTLYTRATTSKQVSSDEQRIFQKIK